MKLKDACCPARNVFFFFKEFFKEENDIDQKLRSANRDTMKEWISEGKIKTCTVFFTLNWTETDKFIVKMIAKIYSIMKVYVYV